MIMFKSDWHHFPTAIVDYKTKNKSFLELAAIYKQMGVENHLFHLSLLQPELQGVDPFDYEWLERHPEYMKKIWLECYYNPWYYLREVCRLKSNAGTDHNPIKANRGIICEFWVRLNNLDLFIMQPRQTGKSVGADALTNWYMLFRASNTNMMLLTKDNSLLGKNIERLKKMREILPHYLITLGAKDKDNQTNYNYALLGNDLIAKAAQKDEDGAINLGRGLTVALLQNDEQPFMKFLHLFYPIALASMNAARQEAEEKGEPHGVLVTTTAGDLTSPEGKYSFNYYHGGCPWNEKNLLDAHDHEDLKERVRKGRTGKAMLVSACFNHRMLGFTDEQFYELINQAPSDEGNIDRDYFLIWSTNSNDPILDKTILESIQKSERDPDYIELTTAGHSINWYTPLLKDATEEEKVRHIENFMKNNYTIIGSDTSEMVGRDSTTFFIQDPRTMSTLATIRIGENNIIETANWFADFMLKYDKTVLNMERKSTGSTFIDTLLLVLHAKGINPFKRIFNQVIQDPSKHDQLYNWLRSGRMPSEDDIRNCRKLFGFQQTGSTRSFLYGTVLKTAARQNQHVIYDKVLSGELRGLRIDKKSGRVDHGVDGHDDMVMAWLLSGWFLMYGNNLDFYGFDRRKVMSNVNNEGKQLDDIDVVDNEYVDYLNEQIETIKREIIRVDHPMILSRLEQRLMKINIELEQYGYEPRNIDALLREARATRQRNKSQIYNHP